MAVGYTVCNGTFYHLIQGVVVVVVVLMGWLVFFFYYFINKLRIAFLFFVCIMTCPKTNSMEFKKAY